MFRNGLRKMITLNYNYFALTNFDRFGFAVNCRNLNSQALAVWVLCQFKQKTISARIPLTLTIKQYPDYRGFFVRAALPALSVGKSQPPERTDDRNHVSAGWGRGCISQDTQDVGVKGLNHAATVSHVRAVAATDLAEPTMKLHAGTANRTVKMVRVQPNPIYDLAIS